MPNKIVAQNFPQQALNDSEMYRAIMNDQECSPEYRAKAALQIVEREFMMRREFARENGDKVHEERACKKLLEIRAARALLEYGLDDGCYPVGAKSPSKIVVA